MVLVSRSIRKSNRSTKNIIPNIPLTLQSNFLKKSIEPFFSKSTSTAIRIYITETNVK